MSEPRPATEEPVCLEQYLDVIRRRRWTILHTAAAVLIAGGVATALVMPIYQAQAQLLVRASAPEIAAMNTENPLVDLLAMAQPESVDTQIQVLRSQPFLDAVFAAAGAPGGRRAPEVRIRGIKDTNVIEVTVESPDPALSARVANTALDHYLEYTRSLSLQEITQARQFVQKEERQAQRGLQRAEAALLDFRRANRVAELTAEQQSRSQELVDLEGKSRETHNNVVRVRAEIGEVQAQLARQPADRVVAIGQASPRVSALQSRLAEAQVERDTLLKSYRPGSPEIAAADAELTSLQAQLAVEPAELRVPLHVLNERRDRLLDRLDSHQTELEGLQAEQARLEPELAQMRGRISQLGPWEVRLAQLQRDRDMAEKSYLMLASKLQDLQIRENARRSTARVIEPAVPPRSPVRPRPALNIAVSLILGLLLGGCLAFVLEGLDDRITTPEEVDRLLGLPVLGHIPAITGEVRLIHALPPHSSAAERYRGLRSSISFSAVDARLATLGITSARIAEGKSTTAVNLALAMAMDARRVILVDTDLRRPSLHRLLGLPASPGLTDVLTGQCSLEEALQLFQGPPHGTPLVVLTSGAVPPNPAEILNTAAMENVIQRLRERSDIVIFDTPPCLPVTDAQVLGARLDGMFLVAQMGEARKAEVRRACELLDQARIRILGLVFNKMTHENGGYYGRYAYHYSYDAGDDHRNGGSRHDPETVLPAKLTGRPGGGSARDRTE